MRRLLPLVLFLALTGSAHAEARIFALAGNGTLADVRDGEPATSAGLLTGVPIAVLPQGGFLVGGGERVWSVDPQGRIHGVAGTGEDGSAGDAGPARSARVAVDGLAVLPQGGFLIADGIHNRVRLVDASGVITTVAGGGTLKPDGVPAARARLDVLRGVAALPGGGFLVSDYRGVVLRVGPDGIIRPFAGNGAAQESQDLDGQRATAASIDVSSMSPQDDGGVLIADYLDGRVARVAPDGTISTLAPASIDDSIDPRGAAATPDGGALVFDDPIIGRALTLPATVTLTVAGKHTTTALPAGVSRLSLPRTSTARPLTVTVRAADGTRAAFDRSRIYPAPWLATETARLVAVSTANVVVRDCRRLTPTRVNCRTGIAPDCGVTSVTYGHGRIAWGRARCGAGAHPRRRALRRSELACDAELPKCPLPLYGRRDEAALLPSD